MSNAPMSSPNITPPQPDRRDDAARLREWLSEHDEACPRCAYNLHALTGTRCPECDAAITLGVKSPDLTLKWFSATLVALCLALGFDGVVTCMLTVVTAIFGPGPPFRFYLFFFSATPLLGLTLIVLLKRRVAFQCLSIKKQRAIAIGTWVGLLLVHIAAATWMAQLW